NLIIPLVGDFTGGKTIRRVGEYLRQHNAAVGAFYVSNVEYYLQGQKLREFQANVATLPVEASSMFIRWVPRPSIPNLTWYSPNMGVVVTTVAPIPELIDLVKAGRAPASWEETLRATKDPAVYARP